MTTDPRGRFVCGNCGHMNTSMANMKRHHEMMHKVARLPEAIVPLTPDSAQEEWVSVAQWSLDLGSRCAG